MITLILCASLYFPYILFEKDFYNVFSSLVCDIEKCLTAMLGEDFIQAYLLHQFCFSECPAQPFSEPCKSEKWNKVKRKLRKVNSIHRRFIHII